MTERLTVMEKDVLTEIANVASGNASTILSEKIGKEIKLSIPFQKLVSVKEIQKHITVPKGVAVCTFAKLKGDILGGMMFAFDRENALILADLLQHKKVGTTQWLSGKDQEALIFMSNTLLGSYLKAMCSFLQLDANVEETKIFSTVGDAIIDLLSVGKPQSPVLVLGSNFTPKGILKAELTFFFFLPTKSIVFLLRKANLLLDKREKR